MQLLLALTLVLSSCRYASCEPLHACPDIPDWFECPGSSDGGDGDNHYGMCVSESQLCDGKTDCFKSGWVFQSIYIVVLVLLLCCLFVLSSWDESDEVCASRRCPEDEGAVRCARDNVCIRVPYRHVCVRKYTKGLSLLRLNLRLSPSPIFVKINQV